MKKTVLFLIVIFCASAFADQKKEEAGILGTLTGYYVKIRTCVRYAYDEVCYFEGVYNDYQGIKAWLDDTKDRWGTLKRTTTEFFRDFEVSTAHLRKLENIFDQVDYLAVEQYNELDRRLTMLENDWDRLAEDRFVYVHCSDPSKKITLRVVPGVLIPNTDQVLDYIDKELLGNNCPTAKGTTTAEDEEAENLTTPIENRVYKYEEEKVKAAGSAITADCMAKSDMYRKWSVVAREKVEDIDNQTTNVSGVNGNDFIAAGFALNMLNQHQKYIKHSMLEAKILNECLGIDLFNYSREKILANFVNASAVIAEGEARKISQ